MNFDTDFIDRRDAGQQLAKHLKSYTRNQDAIILALPRGGVPVAYEVAKALSIPMDIYIVRKLGAPGQEELAMGAIAMDGTVILNDDIVMESQVSESVIHRIMQAEKIELDRRNKLYRENRPVPELSGKIAIIVDDGIATGATMKAAISAIKKCGAKEIVVAVPVCPPSTRKELEEIAGHVVSILTPPMLSSVGQYYQDFSQTTDQEVKTLMEVLEKENLDPF